MSSFVDFERLLKEFFKEIFVEKCLLDDISMTSEEESSIDDLTIPEVFTNLKEIFMELVNFKKDYLTQDKSELLQRNEKFESMLQKLEAEVRNHIRVEHQLKLHIETNQSQAEELEIQNNKLLSQIKDLNDKNKNLGKNPFDRKDSKDHNDKIEKLEAKLAIKTNTIIKLENEILHLKRAVEAGCKENAKKNEIKSCKDKKEQIEEIKQKLEEKALDLQKFEQVIKEKAISKPMKERNRSLRKSFAENDIGKTKPHEVKVQKSVGKVHSRSVSEQVRPVSAAKKRS
ncbi:hypothetical protein SteCoe_2133 [Stentor coeruleus]|uniref:Uncharacterized protein n=1 Tax=Stentor coeruleus TaxID=5963 RepID=A0A1R2D085_9CILI|nr:hypothetical protein SteCoe_2133 [Stentor coeruleus]